jgi:protein associated with RNAse G/E
MYCYRVRGPYATALAKIILDAGFDLVDVSRSIAERLRIEEKAIAIPHATIKESDEDPSTLIVIGHSDAVKALLDEITSRIPFIVTVYEELGPYTTIAVRVMGYDRLGRCIGKIGEDREVVIQDIKECIEGAIVITHIVKPSQRLGNGKAITLPGIAVLKDTLVLLDDKEGKVFFSEHIRDYERKSLLSSLASQAVRQGFSIRWRSSAKSAPLEVIAKDLETAMEELRKLRSMSVIEPRIISFGETIAFITLSRASKEYLDIVRNTVVPTSPYHHVFRTCRKHLDVCVELLDHIASKTSRDLLEKEIKEFVVRSIVGKEVILRHEIPGRGYSEIGPLTILKVLETKFGLALVGKRIIQRDGIYNGLGVEKKAGDIALTLIPIDEWFIVHAYFDRNGSEKGMYININTPPEICPASTFIKYLDLFVDVAIVKNNVRIVDLEQLEEARRKGLIGEDLVYIAEETIRKVLTIIEVIQKILKESQFLEQ